MSDMEYSVVIPVYNSGEWMDELIAAIQKVMDTLDGKYEIVMVNDGSPKLDTWDIMLSMCEKYKHMKMINLQYNSGQLNALLCAMKNSSGKYVITMDDDFQHSPDEIPKLVAKIKETNCDCVIANYAHKEHNGFRKLGSKFANFLSHKIYKKPKNITSNSFRIMKRDLAVALTSYRGKFPQIGPMIFSLTRNIDVVTIEHKERKYGKSGYSVGHLITETMNIIINGSTFPIDFMAIFGFIVSGISFVIAFVYFILYIVGSTTVPGFTAQILATSFFSGVITFSIGIVGKYIGKIVKESSGFPPYLEREIKHSKED
jgi:glycosyltransferase involved in cell wall biosynthesis